MDKLFWPLMENAITFTDKLKMASFCLTSDKFTNGPKVREFEEAWSKWVGCKYSLYVSSGSTANFLLIAALKEFAGLKNNDKVLVPACTWMTSVAPIIQNGLQPIFMDVSLEDYCIDLDDLSTIQYLHPDIKLIFTTHLLGYHSNVEKLQEAFPDAVVMEDCCEAHGVKDQYGKRAGNDSLGATFSFYYGHHITTIEGGFISTNNHDLYTLMRMKRSHGLAREAGNESFEIFKQLYPDIVPSFLFVTDGYNFRNNEIGAVLGLEQIKRLDKNIAIRNNNYSEYYSMISKRSDLFHIPSCKLEQMSSFALPFVCKSKDIYNILIQKFKEHNIEYRPLVAGNLLKQPFLNAYKFRYHKRIYNADIIHDLGLYVGNSHSVNKKHLSVLKQIIESLPNAEN
jgi:CDP-6-deoxy-D-xylo-4-hexulose-3-dehydrase